MRQMTALALGFVTLFAATSALAASKVLILVRVSDHGAFTSPEGKPLRLVRVVENRAAGTGQPGAPIPKIDQVLVATKQQLGKTLLVEAVVENDRLIDPHVLGAVQPVGQLQPR